METKLLRTVEGTAIPSGEKTALESGMVVTVTQSLGGNLTVVARGGLYRITRMDADAVEGYALPDEPQEFDSTVAFSEEAVWDALKTCFDPEIPVNIVDLGLIYDLAIETDDAGSHLVEVKMTLTAQGCGMGPVIAEDAKEKIATLPGVREAKVHIVWDPVWTPQMISESGRKSLGLE